MRHYRLKFVDILLAHQVGLQMRPGMPGILNEDAIRSAIARPYNGYYRPIQKKGAALVESVCKNHGFVDGNKRTAFILLLILVQLSGYRLTPHNGEDLGRSLENMVLAVANSEMAFDDIESWLKLRISKQPGRKRNN